MLPMTPDESPVRRYRRLLLAYPRWHRRLYGPDLLTTLLDAAAAGRRSGPLREALTIVFDGLRCRVRVSGIRGYVLAAAMSLVGAATLAAVTGWCGWLGTTPPLPTVQQATALAAPAAPSLQDGIGTTPFTGHAGALWINDGESSRSPIFAVLGGGTDFMPDGVYFTYPARFRAGPAPQGDCASPYTTAHDALTAVGWRIRSTGGHLIAERSGMRLTMRCSAGDVTIWVYPTPSPLPYHLAWGGAVLGALLGWLAAAAGLAYGRRLPPERRFGLFSVALGLVGAGLAMAVPASLLSLAAVVVADSDGAARPPWFGFSVLFARPAAGLAALLFAAALLCSGLMWAAGSPGRTQAKINSAAG